MARISTPSVEPARPVAAAEEAMSEAYVPTQQPQAGEEARVPQTDVHPGRKGGAPSPPAQGSNPAVRLIWHVEHRELFLALRSARRGRSGPLSVARLPADAAGPPRVAFAIGRKVGGAVERNRLRRRLRALLRDPARPLPPGTYLVAAAPGATSAGFDELARHLEVAVARAQPLGTPADG